MGEDVAFTSAGLTCRGWLYRPANGGRRPAIVMSHGFSAVKEQGLAEFAEAFAAAGFVVLVFDFRCLGASDGSERGRIIAQEQHDDLRAALAFASVQSDVDSDRVGLWGASFSGGHALFLGALDPRVKAVVAQVPALDNVRSLLTTIGRERFSGYLSLFAGDHAARNSGGPGFRVPIVAPRASRACSRPQTPTPGSWRHERLLRAGWRPPPSRAWHGWWSISPRHSST
jgi:hypothetical protein